MLDILVIGGGPGGYAAAIRAAQLGAKGSRKNKITFRLEVLSSSIQVVAYGT